MALARCVVHKPEGTKHSYDFYAFPIGYPESTAAICGRELCYEPALVWLAPEEVQSHRSGNRVFDVHTAAVKLRVGDELEKA